MDSIGKRNLIIRVIIAIVLIAIVAMVAHKIYVNSTKPIDERAYEMAVDVVERDILNNIVPHFEEYDPKYIKWISLDLLKVEINAEFIQNGIWKDIKYNVYVDISDGQCLPGIPERVLEE